MQKFLDFFRKNFVGRNRYYHNAFNTRFRFLNSQKKKMDSLADK
ncbi:hypothetical protein LEP1GSC050_2118 [Leptospira broomii serovar Hurstbridge str. 5399]|uniref:Uncharacterized protein n=1 Tax=Leptospira broomii serovar Hurstbridge str. 5399 TaxID=1049789 RepID=T0FC96_9LEPT|nr:hypothetical protein LEP1GSC050_2118 [Leptospira broomii serovar Hurstbridge str. 5399]